LLPAGKSYKAKIQVKNPLFVFIKLLHSMRTSRPGKLTGHHQPANSNLVQFNVPGFEVLQPVTLDENQPPRLIPG